MNLQALRDNGITTINALSILLACESKVTMSELVSLSNVTLRGIQRFMERHPSLFRKIKYTGVQGGQGKNIMYQYKRSAKAERILRKAEVI